MQACFLGHTNVIHRLCQVENIDVNIRDDEGYSALLLAVWSNQLEAVLALLLDRDHRQEVVERRWEASLTLLQDVLSRSQAGTIKREREEEFMMIVTYFLFGKTRHCY